MLLALPASRPWRERLRAQRHIRPHVNPLHRRFTAPPLAPAVAAFARAQPLHVDLGCGKGHFCAELAEACPALNVLGLEIREPLAREAQRLARHTANLRFLSGSANACAASAVDALVSGGGGAYLHSVSVQFPDPWPKRRHRKRRIVQPRLVAELVERLPAEGFVFLQSDVEEVALEMRAAFLSCASLCETSLDEEGVASVWNEEEVRWLDERQRPFGEIKTERERQAARRGLPIFRTLLIHKSRGNVESGG
ncbi:hypothetical protein AB1Y20_003168 [Prymnesium parvum]